LWLGHDCFMQLSFHGLEGGRCFASANVFRQLGCCTWIFCDQLAQRCYFLGDAGAYLIGFWVVELGILLAMRNPKISPMAPVVAGLLPLIETLFSMYRRNVVRNHPVNQPDALHLHTLVYRRLLFNPELKYSSNQLNAVNAKVALYFWLPATIFATLSCIFAESTEAQLGLMLIYLIMYRWLYSRIVRFKVPAFMKFR